jgi:hypothetical protein
MDRGRRVADPPTGIIDTLQNGFDDVDSDEETEGFDQDGIEDSLDSQRWI